MVMGKTFEDKYGNTFNITQSAGRDFSRAHFTTNESLVFTADASDIELIISFLQGILKSKEAV